MKPQILDTIEWESIARSIDTEYGDGISRKLLGARTPIVLIDKDWRNIYLVPTAWMRRLLEETPVGFDYHLVGRQLGVVAKDGFRLSLQIIPELVKLTTKVVIVSRRGAEAFTYGRSILKASVVWYEPNLKRGQRVLIVNEEHDCLGIASLTVDATRIEYLSQDSLVGKNLVDIGWFIRRLG